MNIHKFKYCKYCKTDLSSNSVLKNFLFPAYYISSDFQVVPGPIIPKLFVKYGFNLSLQITLKSFEDSRNYFYLI